jgi:hypothetical protein
MGEGTRLEVGADAFSAEVRIDSLDDLCQGHCSGQADSMCCSIDQVVWQWQMAQDERCGGYSALIWAVQGG